MYSLISAKYLFTLLYSSMIHAIALVSVGMAKGDREKEKLIFSKYSVKKIAQGRVKSVMKIQISYANILLNLTALSTSFLLNPAAQAISLSFPTLSSDSQVGGVLCKNIVTVLPCNDSTEKLTSLAWGQVGAIGYALGAEEMLRRNPSYSDLTSTQKSYLNPYFGDLVERVHIHYSALLLNELGAPGSDKKVGLQDTKGQTFGLDIYISDPYETMFQQLALIGHELIHSRQYEERDSNLVKFGYDYFFEFSNAGQSYEDNVMEQDAYSWQWDFIANDCASKSFSGVCLREEEEKYIEKYNYDYAAKSSVPVFYFAEPEIEVPEYKQSAPYSLSEAEQLELALILKSFTSDNPEPKDNPEPEPVPEPSSTLSMFLWITLGAVWKRKQKKQV